MEGKAIRLNCKKRGVGLRFHYSSSICGKRCAMEVKIMKGDITTTSISCNNEKNGQILDIKP